MTQFAAFVRLREFIAEEIAEAEGWTDVPQVYESGYVSALKVVDRHIEEEMARVPLSEVVGKEAAAAIEYGIAHPEERRPRPRRKGPDALGQEQG